MSVRRFTWDEAKRQENVRKHAIDFADLPQVFEGKVLTSRDDGDHYNEERFVSIGLLRHIVVLIAHTETDDEIRIIHARKANRETARHYFEYFGN